VGFRADWRRGVSEVTLQGDAYRGGKEPYGNLAPRLRGGNLLARWTDQLGDGSPVKVQAYFDQAARDEVTVFRNTSRTVDLQFTHEPRSPHGQQWLWGAGYRRSRDSNEPNALILFVPQERLLSWANVFAQHQLTLAERWQLTLGVKAERNSYTGLEYLPSARLAYQHSPRETTWAAASRVVRAPSRIDRDFFFPAREPFFIAGGAGFQSETANVLEFGHRGHLASTLSYSATLFQHYYKGLRAGIPGQVPAVVSNQIEGPSRGLEAWASWQATPDWRLMAGLLNQRKNLRFSSGATDATSIPNLGNDPRFQWHLRSNLNLGARTDFDLIVRRVGALPTPAVPAYTAVDARLAMRVAPGLELSLIGQNLFDRRHAEFRAVGLSSQFERRVFIKAEWQL
jgi:iron complex outermembrane receptor protein